MPAATRFTRSTDVCVLGVRLLVALLVALLALFVEFFAALFVVLFVALLRVGLPVADVLVLVAVLAAPPFRAADLLATVPRPSVLLLLVEPVFRAALLVLLFVPLLRAAVLVPLVFELDLRAPELGDADLRAAVFRRGDALDELDDPDDDLGEERFGALLWVPPVREPALRLELFADDFLVAML